MTFATKGSSYVVTLNRPKALNALSLGMVRLLAPVPTLAAPAAGTSCVVLEGAGGRAFCAGGDVRTIYDQKGSLPRQCDFFREEYFVDHALARHGNTSVPHVALWDGVVMGGGVGISMHAPFRVATERTLFAMPETAIGIFPDVGGSYALPRLPLGPWWGLYLGLTGARVAGADAVHGGLATHYVPSARLGDLKEALSALPLGQQQQPYAARHAAVERVVRAHASALPPFSYTPDALGALRGAFSTGATQAAPFNVPTILQRLKDAAAAASGGGGGSSAAVVAAAATALAAMSPTACAVALECQRRGAAMGSLGAVLSMELRAISRLVGPPNADFYEGIRFVLVDKSKGPPPVWRSVGAADGLSAIELKAYFEGGEDIEGEAALRSLPSHLA